MIFREIGKESLNTVFGQNPRTGVLIRANNEGLVFRVLIPVVSRAQEDSFEGDLLKHIDESFGSKWGHAWGPEPDLGAIKRVGRTAIVPNSQVAWTTEEMLGGRK